MSTRRAVGDRVVVRVAPGRAGLREGVVDQVGRVGLFVDLGDGNRVHKLDHEVYDPEDVVDADRLVDAIEDESMDRIAAGLDDL